MVDTTGEAHVEVPFEVRLADLIPFGYRLACGLLHDPAQAEDAVQEAAIKAWRRQARLRPGSDARPWFLAIVANECRSLVRGRWWSMLRLPAREVAVPAGDDTVLRHADLRRAILSLTPGARLVVVLFFYLDLPLEQVARIAGVSTSAARGRLYRSIKRLRPRLDPEEALQ